MKNFKYDFTFKNYDMAYIASELFDAERSLRMIGIDRAYVRGLASAYESLMYDFGYHGESMLITMLTCEYEPNEWAMTEFEEHEDGTTTMTLHFTKID